MIKILLRTFLVLLFHTINAQNINTKLYNYFDGMPSDDLMFVCYSEQAGIELCSRKGIIQFDGNRFYLENPTKFEILNAYFFNNALYYEDGVGLFKKDYSNMGKISQILSKNYMDDDPNNDHFENLFVDSRGRIWSSDFNHVKYHHNNKTFKFLLFPENKNLNKSVFFTEISPNEILIFCEDGVYEWHTKSQQLVKSSKKYLSDLNVTAIAKNGDLLAVATKSGLLLLVDVAKNKIIKKTATPNTDVLLQLEWHEKALFCISSHEIYTYENDGFSLSYKTTDFQIKHFLVNSKTNNYWAATTKGLLQLHLPKKGLTFLNLPEKYRKSTNYIIDIIEPVGNEFWVLTSMNQVFLYKNNTWQLLHQFEKSNNVKSFTWNKKIYVTTTKGIYAWNNTSFKNVNLLGFKEDNEVVKSVFVNDQEVWVLSSNKQIETYNWLTKKKIDKKLLNTTAFWTDNKWNDLAIDANKNIWLVGWMPKGFGICRYDAVQNKFIDISSKEFHNERDAFVGDYYNRIHTSDKSDILFSAYGGFSVGNGKGILSKKVDVLSYPIDDTYVTGLMKDVHDNIFFATNAGLHVFLKKLDKVVKFNTTDGLSSNKLQYGFTKISGNRLMLGGENLVTIVDCDKILETPLRNTIQLTKILINNEEQSAEKLTNLEHHENNITIQFSTFSYIEKSKIFYEYSLNNEPWISLGNQSELMFNQMVPGSYTLKIKATDYLQNEVKNQLKFEIKVNPPFTKSTTFYVLVGFLVLTLIYGLFRYSLHRKIKDKKYQIQVKDAEMRMLRAQMNPHFMFNTLNSINSYIIQNKTEDASKYLTSFSKLMHMILESSKQPWVTLKQEIKSTELYLQLEAVRLDHSFDVLSEVSEEINQNEIHVPPLIIQPYAENSIWHGLRHLTDKRGVLKIKFNLLNENLLVIEIEDNGIGRMQSNLIKNKSNHTSYGLKITEERVKSSNSKNHVVVEDLLSSTNKALGTKVSIYLNLEQND